MLGVRSIGSQQVDQWIKILSCIKCLVGFAGAVASAGSFFEAISVSGQLHILFQIGERLMQYNARAH